MKNIFKYLIISILYFVLYSCKSNSTAIRNTNLERTDTTDDVIDSQLDDYQQIMQQQNNQSY
jgi:hypothetical protein